MSKVRKELRLSETTLSILKREAARLREVDPGLDWTVSSLASWCLVNGLSHVREASHREIGLTQGPDHNRLVVEGWRRWDEIAAAYPDIMAAPGQALIVDIPSPGGS